MIKIRSILHPTDFSEYSAAAMELAEALARRYGARIWIAHVAPPEEILHGAYFGAPPPPREDLATIEKKLYAIKPADRTIPVGYALLRGDPADEIVRLARRENCDLIVMGTHGRSGLQRVLVGSVAERVLRRAPCPVLTIRLEKSEAKEAPHG